MINNKSRRDFIKKSALTVAGISVGTAAFPTIDVKGTIIGTNDKVRMGIIGVGNRGTQLLQALTQVPDFKLTALCDLYQPYLTRKKESVDPRYLVPRGRPVPAMGENFGSDIALYNDYRKMLEDKNMDAVCIATALLANIALEVKQRVEWDPVKERFANSNAANELLHYKYRKPWKL